jgi:hypothetical protein
LHGVRRVLAKIYSCRLHDLLIHGRHGQTGKTDDQNFEL